jgi:hypothetical protein
MTAYSPKVLLIAENPLRVSFWRNASRVARERSVLVVKRPAVACLGSQIVQANLQVRRSKCRLKAHC